MYRQLGRMLTPSPAGALGVSEPERWRPLFLKTRYSATG